MVREGHLDVLLVYRQRVLRARCWWDVPCAVCVLFSVLCTLFPEKLLVELKTCQDRISSTQRQRGGIIEKTGLGGILPQGKSAEDN